ncbi:MAG: heparinase II/III family protein, partial [Candidatus Hydrogenedentes bacterium]|nr:heparinase II/III family protein [Candidatus Hydrogenedentota bacterium]
MSIGQTIHTIRYLRAGQAFAQVRHRLRPFWERPEKFFLQPVPDVEVLRWPENRSFLPPGPQVTRAEPVQRGKFEFLNHEEYLGWPPSDWNVAGLPKLWQYNLHYFDWLWGLGYTDVREGVLGWIDRHPLGRARIGWDPYPLSLRLLNWCAVCFGKFRAETEADPEFIQKLWQSIYLQAEWLSRHLETHLLGNHLFENGAALAFAGSCFGGVAGERWLHRGLHILEREIPEQILPDGMHFELSCMYHVRITYLLRLLLDTGNEVLCA